MQRKFGDLQNLPQDLRSRGRREKLRSPNCLCMGFRQYHGGLQTSRKLGQDPILVFLIPMQALSSLLHQQIVYNIGCRILCLANLSKSSQSRVTILLASSVWMLVHCVVKYSRPPDLKSSSNVSFPFAWITGPAKVPSLIRSY